MTDPLTSRERSELMAKVRSTGNLSTEVRAESALLASNIGGWVKHHAILGKPDFYFPAEKLVVFVDGCFWHGCPLHGRLPKTNVEYWQTKIEQNRKRDLKIRRRLRKQGYHVMRVWEHNLRSDTWLKRLRSILKRLSTPLPEMPAPSQDKQVFPLSEVTDQI